MASSRIRRGLVWLALCWPLPGLAAVFTVGSSPGATHATLESAWTAAIATAGTHEIRMASQFHAVGATLSLPAGRGPITVSGGWDGDFLAQPNGREFSILVPQPVPVGTVLQLSAAESTVTLRNLTLAQGSSSSLAGGMVAMVSGTARLVLDNVAVRDNSSSASAGAGAAVFASGNSQVEVHDSRFHHNAHSGSGAAGAGLYLFLDNGARGTITGTQFDNNTSSAPGENGALWIGAGNGAQVQVNDCFIQDNAFTASEVSATGLLVQSGGGAFVNLERLRVFGNTANGASTGTRAQVQLGGSGGAITFLTDSLIYGGPQRGLAVYLFESFTTARLNNLTVARHADVGVFTAGDGAGILTMHNSIVHGNAGTSFLMPLMPQFSLGADLMAADPLFVNAAGNDFHLAAGSPGLDAGTASVPGGLGALDLDRQARVIGPSVDIGAFESMAVVLPDAMFNDQFEGTP